MSKNIKTTFGEFIKENREDKPMERPVISITKQIEDERSPSENENPNYDVIYTITINQETFEFSGELTSYNSGRSIEYEFNPSFFIDDESEEYYNDNYESIEEEILEILNNM